VKEIDHAPVLDAGVRARIVGERLEAVRRAAGGRAGVLLQQRRDFAWLTLGGQNHVLLATDQGAAPLLVAPDRAVVLAPVNEADRIADEEVAGLPLEVEALPWWEPGAAHEAARRICASDDVATADEIATPLEELRTALDPVEHQRMAWLGRLAGTAMAEVVGQAQEGQTEQEVGAALAQSFTANGVRLPVLLAAADERIARYRHPLPGRAPLRQRLMVVVVVERWGLHVAQTMFRELIARDEELARRAAGLDQVLAAMADATAVDAMLGDVLQAARRAYSDAGMEEEWGLHHQGGTIGYAARERIAVPGDPTRIRPGMAFAWNPSARGHKLEATLYLDAEGRRHTVTPLVS
jgi:Xaa-Pro aminopeptidase